MEISPPLTKHKFVWLSLIVFVIALLPSTSYAGTGTFKDGKFSFCVSVRFNATEVQLQRIRQGFEVANPLLADATDGQHQFGRIDI